MAIQHFGIDDTLWAERVDNLVMFHRSTQLSKEQQRDDVVLEMSIDTLRNVVVWADQEHSVTASLTGPMASQVRQAALDLGLTPEMFIWHAVKLFLEAGS